MTNGDGGDWDDLEPFGFGDETLDHIYEDVIGDQDSEHMRDLFRTGWQDENVSSDDRVDARDAFRDWLLEHDVNFDELFDWDDWRDWYENAA